MIIYASKARDVPFFRACLNHNFKEQQEKIIHLPEDDPEVVDAFLRLLVLAHHNDFDRLWEVLELHHGRNETGVSASDALIAKMYILADKLGAEEQQNTLVDYLRYHYQITGESMPSPDALDALADAGLQRSKMFKFIVRHFAYKLRELFTSLDNVDEDSLDSGDDEDAEPLPEDFPFPAYKTIREWARRGGIGVSAVLFESARRKHRARSEITGHSRGLKNYKSPSFTPCNKWHTHSATIACNSNRAFESEEARIRLEERRSPSP
jgi:hypothetical protein